MRRRIRRAVALAAVVFVASGQASRASSELEEAYASVHAWIDESLASDDPAAASLARSQAALAFGATRAAMEMEMEKQEGRRQGAMNRPSSSSSVLVALEEAAAGAGAAAEEEEESSGEDEEGLWLRATDSQSSSSSSERAAAKGAAAGEQGSGNAAATTPPTTTAPASCPPASAPASLPPPTAPPPPPAEAAAHVATAAAAAAPVAAAAAASAAPVAIAAAASDIAASSASSEPRSGGRAAADAAAGAASAASSFTSARAEEARAEIVAATTYSELNEQGMDASRPPEFCARAGLDAFPPPMASDPPACDAADPSSPALFLRPSAGGAFLGTVPTAITSSEPLREPPGAQAYQMMYLASLPYFPLPATDDSHWDNYRGNADACIAAMGLSFPPARFVANVTSTSAASELLRGARARLRAKKEALGLGGGRPPRNPSQGASSNANNDADPAAAASPPGAAAAAAPQGEVEAGLAKALVLHTPTDVFVVFRGTMSRRDFDHINLVVYPVEAGAFYGARGGEKVFVHAGYHKAASLLMPRIEEHVAALAASGAVSPDYTVWFVGHSMGASLATLGALRWTAASADRSSLSSPAASSSPDPASSPSSSRLARLGGVYLLSSPRVMWNDASQRFYNARVGPRTVRFSYQGDVVADAPPRDWGYLAVGSGVAACADDDEARRTGLERLAATPLGLDRGDGCNTRENAFPSLQNVLVHGTRDALFGPSYKGTVFEWARFGGGRHFRSLMWDGFLRGGERVAPGSLASPGMSCVARALSRCPGLANGCFHVLRCGLWRGGKGAPPPPAGSGEVAVPYCGASCSLDASCSPPSAPGPGGFTGAFNDAARPLCLDRPSGSLPSEKAQKVREPRMCRGAAAGGAKAGLLAGLG